MLRLSAFAILLVSLYLFFIFLGFALIALIAFTLLAILGLVGKKLRQLLRPADQASPSAGDQPPIIEGEYFEVTNRHEDQDQSYR